MKYLASNGNLQGHMEHWYLTMFNGSGLNFVRYTFYYKKYLACKLPKYLEPKKAMANRSQDSEMASTDPHL